MNLNIDSVPQKVFFTTFLMAGFLSARTDNVPAKEFCFSWASMWEL